MIFKTIHEDITAFKERDPAARSGFEVIVLYQGFHALLFYRVAHRLWGWNWRFLGRLISQFARILTGIEIHPGASIGRRFVIDHGSGVVIGETSVIGDDVTLYHDVTLGGVSPSVDSHTQVGQKRHPTIKNGAIVGSGAQILGPIVVGVDARVGANAVVTSDIPGGVTAVGVPARIIMPKNRKEAKEFHAYALMDDGQPDPLTQTIDSLRQQVAALINRVEELEDKSEESKTTNKTNKKTPAA